MAPFQKAKRAMPSNWDTCLWLRTMILPAMKYSTGRNIQASNGDGDSKKAILVIQSVRNQQRKCNENISVWRRENSPGPHQIRLNAILHIASLLGCEYRFSIAWLNKWKLYLMGFCLEVVTSLIVQSIQRCPESVHIMQLLLAMVNWNRNNYIIGERTSSRPQSFSQSFWWS